MKKWVKDILAYSIIAGVFGFIIFRLTKDRETLKAIDWTSHPGFLACHIALMALVYIVFVAGWFAVLRQIGVRWSARRVAASWLVPNLGKYVPGKVGMLLGRVELCHRYAASRTVCFAALVLEHVLSFLGAVPFFFVALLYGAETTSIRTIAALLLLALGCSIFIFRPQLLNRCLGWALKIFKKPPVEFRLTGRSIVPLWPVYVLLWLCYGLSGWALVTAFGLGDGLPVVMVISSFVVSWLIGFASLLTPGGLGVREAVLISLLGGYVPFTYAMAVAVLARLSWTIAEMLGVCLGVLVMKHLPDESQMLIRSNN